MEAGGVPLTTVAANKTRKLIPNITVLDSSSSASREPRARAQT